MLRWRVISGTIVVAVLCIVCWVDFHFNFQRPGLWLLPLGMVICFLATAEFVSLVSVFLVISEVAMRRRWANSGRAEAAMKLSMSWLGTVSA